MGPSKLAAMDCLPELERLVATIAAMGLAELAAPVAPLAALSSAVAPRQMRTMGVVFKL